jgi:ribonuclease HI
VKDHFIVYTDGSAKGRWGSWSFLILADDKIIYEDSGRERKTNSNRMEFQAIIEALFAIPGDHPLTFYTDSKILLENLPMFKEWKANGWLKANGWPIPNVDLMIILDELILTRQIQWKWVRAHSGNQYNERCDQLCILAREGTVLSV